MVFNTVNKKRGSLNNGVSLFLLKGGDTYGVGHSGNIFFNNNADARG